MISHHPLASLHHRPHRRRAARRRVFAGDRRARDARHAAGDEQPVGRDPDGRRHTRRTLADADGAAGRLHDPVRGSGDGDAPAPTSTPTATIIVRAYFLANEHLVPVLREVPKTQAVATAAMRQLLAGPNARERAASPALVTTVPGGTQLLGLSITDGVATVDLSREYESGGGSASMFGRLSQVVYTLTQFSTVQGVLFELDGQPVTIFGGEGLILDHPVGRADYHDQLPAIFVDRPAWGAALGNPGKVTGLANTFEATFQVQLRDANGTLLYDQHQMATCGTGCWGTFEVQVGYTVAKAQWGTLRVLDYSAKDGTPENVTDYPVWLTPAT